MRIMEKAEAVSRIAKNAALLIDEMATDSFLLNLGVGIPGAVADHITNPNIYIHAENGMIGVGPLATGDQIHPQLINASRQPVTETPGCCYMDSALAFGLIRGGYVDASVLGAFQVDQEANVANWIIPGGSMLGVGGAMDLTSAAKLLIIAMRHTGKDGSKLVPRCTLPITAFGCVSYVVTEYGVFHFCEKKESGSPDSALAPEKPGKTLLLEKIAPDISLAELRALTGIPFTPADNLGQMVL